MPSRISVAASLTLLAAFSAKAGPEVPGAYAACAIAVSGSIQQNWVLPKGAVSGKAAPVRLRIELKKDGFLARPAVVTSPMGSPLCARQRKASPSPFSRSFTSSARP